MAKYALVASGTGLLNGGFIETTINNGNLPSNAVGPITETQWAAWVNSPMGYYWNGSVVMTYAASAQSPTGYSTMAAGCTVHSTGTPAINATYPCDRQTLNNLVNQLAYVTAKSQFPASLAALTIADITAAVHVFGSTTLFTNFVEALISFVTQCQQFDLGVAGVTLPGTLTIA